VFGQERLEEELAADFDSAAPLQMWPVAVHSFTPGAAVDGNGMLLVRYRGATIRTPYLKSYLDSLGGGVPQPGDIVILLKQGESRLVLGRAIGVNFVPSPDTVTGDAPVRTKTFTHGG
jgi:hypothetical protein